MISYMFLFFLLPISIYGQELSTSPPCREEPFSEICLRKFQEAKTCMDKFPLSKEFVKAPFSEKVKNEQFLNDLFQSELCMTDGECESYREFRLYLSDTESHVTYFANTTCITSETLPVILKTCNERNLPISPMPHPPIPPIPHSPIPHPCDRFTDSCLIDELRKQGQCSSGQLGSFQNIYTHALNRCQLLRMNSVQWSRYFNLIGMKIDFPDL
ncbi:hypothetical protein B9Z55_012443 [Caenorhabditis nigoni]|uniref:DUF19 domain-containing protein n=2 Tax=Caenorhabditis nigoni TaxID=1611254 RepID=A0A2G5TX86_9PELO|nr:hypothetical protein B9Z55_012443 [Caenorhabditis nigoni]